MVSLFGQETMAGEGEPLGVEGVTLQDRIGMGAGDGDVEDVTGLQAVDLPRSGDPAVEAGLLEVRLPPQHQHRLRVFEEVDGLAVADDLQGVEGDGLGVRAPDHVHRLHAGKPLGLQDLDDAAVVVGVARRIEAGLVVVEQHLDGRRALVGRRRRDGGDIHPGRRRPEGGLVSGEGRERAGHGGQGGAENQT
jgi:hypothetical protein